MILFLFALNTIRLRCFTRGLIQAVFWAWSYPGLADGLSVAIHSASWATALEVCSKFMGERYPSAECRRWELYQPSMY